MTTTLIAAVAVGLIAPLVRAWAWGVPPLLLSPAMMLTSFFGSALTVLVVGAAFNVGLRATELGPERIDLTAGLLGAGVGLVLLLNSERRMRDVRGLSVLCQRLLEPDSDSRALRSLRRLLDRAKAKDPKRHAALALMATGPLTQTANWDDARTQLLAIDEATLDPGQLVLRNQALATCQLQFDDPHGALATIERIQRPTEPSIEVWLVAMEALVAAVTGDPRRAEVMLAGQHTEDNPSLDASHRLVWAHIFAAKGDEPGAARELQALSDAAGRAGVERVLRPRGPASALAEAMLVRERSTRAPGA